MGEKSAVGLKVMSWKSAKAENEKAEAAKIAADREAAAKATLGERKPSVSPNEARPLAASGSGGGGGGASPQKGTMHGEAGGPRGKKKAEKGQPYQVTATPGETANVVDQLRHAAGDQKEETSKLGVLENKVIDKPGEEKFNISPEALKEFAEKMKAYEQQDSGESILDTEKKESPAEVKAKQDKWFEDFLNGKIKPAVPSDTPVTPAEKTPEEAAFEALPDWLKDLQENYPPELKAKADAAKAAAEAANAAKAKEKEEREALSVKNQAIMGTQSEQKWEETRNIIETVRRDAGLGASSLSSDIQKVTDGQPVSECLYRLVDVGSAPQSQERQALVMEALAEDMKVVAEERLRHGGYTAKQNAASAFTDDFNMEKLVERFDRAIRKQANELRASDYPLSKAEKAMVVYYTHYGDETMNKHLRELTEMMKNISTITDPNQRALAEMEMQSFLSDPRNKQKSAMCQTLMDALAKMPQYQGTVYRGMNKDAMKWVDKGIYYNGGFSSTTSGEARDGFWGQEIQMAMRTDRGVNIAPFSKFETEEEILLFPGVMFNVDMKTADLGQGIGDTIDHPLSDDPARRARQSRTFVAMRQMENPTTIAPIKADDKRAGDETEDPDWVNYRGQKRELTDEERAALAKQQHTTSSLIKIKERKQQMQAMSPERYNEELEKILSNLTGNARKAAEEMMALPGGGQKPSGSKPTEPKAADRSNMDGIFFGPKG